MVFKALTDKSELAQWMPVSEAPSMEARVGGEYEFKYYWAEKNWNATAKGKILELIPNKRLSYTFSSEDVAPGVKNSVVTWILEELPNGRTRVTVVHSGVTWPGYEYFLNQLAKHCREMVSKKE